MSGSSPAKYIDHIMERKSKSLSLFYIKFLHGNYITADISRSATKRDCACPPWWLRAIVVLRLPTSALPQRGPSPGENHRHLILLPEERDVLHPSCSNTVATLEET